MIGLIEWWLSAEMVMYAGRGCKPPAPTSGFSDFLWLTGIILLGIIVSNTPENTSKIFAYIACAVIFPFIAIYEIIKSLFAFVKGLPVSRQKARQETKEDIERRRRIEYWEQKDREWDREHGIEQ